MPILFMVIDFRQVIIIPKLLQYFGDRSSLNTFPNLRQLIDHVGRRSWRCVLFSIKGRIFLRIDRFTIGLHFLRRVFPVYNKLGVFYFILILIRMLDFDVFVVCPPGTPAIGNVNESLKFAIQFKFIQISTCLVVI